MADMQTSDDMVSQIIHFEGFKTVAYRDSVGVLTIGCGHTGPDVTPGLTITEDQVYDLLGDDLSKFEAGVMRLCPTSDQKQFDAMVSFSYNVGLGNLQNSTLRKKHNAGDYPGAAAEFGRWNKAGGNVLRGLTIRRAAEAQVYSGGDYTTG